MEPYNELKVKLDKLLLLISKQNSTPAQQAKRSIAVCNLTLEKLRQRVKFCGFQTKEQEIKFFKHLKPSITGQLLFYIQVFNIETGKPSGSEKQLIKFLNNHFKSINRFNDDNNVFYKYYRSESVFMDEKYFVRSKSNLHLVLDQNHFNYDIDFNTSHDNKVAQVIANDLVQDYLQRQLNKIEINLFSENPHSSTILPKKQLKWTDSKIAMIELMYALHAAKCINSGKADLSEIATVFEDAFDIELKDYYRKYLEIKDRKGNNTKFLDTLKQALGDRINIELQ